LRGLSWRTSSLSRKTRERSGIILRGIPTSRTNGTSEDLVAELGAAAVDLRPALERITVPIYILDREGRIRWLNNAARELVGNAVGREFTAVVAPEHTLRAREAFARKLLGAEVTDFDLHLMRPDGIRVPVQISSAPLKDGGNVVGVFGVARAIPTDEAEALPTGAELTPRQFEVLRLLAEGCSTAEIADQLGVSVQTVRNHVREILRRLRVKSRIAALASARRHGLL
jgi:PAS domain S-box-containing protein